MEEPDAQSVVVSFVGRAPVRQIKRAAGVRDVEVEGSTLRCTVIGSFQPLLEALRGYEVITFSTTTVSSSRPQGGN